MEKQKREHPGYRARQQSVDVVLSLNELLCNIFERARSRKDCPVWLTEGIAQSIRGTNLLILPLENHRDELPKYLENQ